jgi:hypothetical protein
MNDNVNCIKTFVAAHGLRNHLRGGKFPAKEHRDHFGTQSSEQYRNVPHGGIYENNLANIAQAFVHGASSTEKFGDVICRRNC